MPRKKRRSLDVDPYTPEERHRLRLEWWALQLVHIADDATVPVDAVDRDALRRIAYAFSEGKLMFGTR